MKGFDWTIEQTVARLSRSDVFSEAASRNFLHPHDGIWGNGERFAEYADLIANNLSVTQRRLFATVCLASWLLNPGKAPVEAAQWLRSNCDIHDLIGIDCTWEQIVYWKWGRVAIAVADTEDKNRGRIFFCLSACCDSGEINSILPNWASPGYMDKSACNAVEIAADLANRKTPEMAFFLWPILGNSLYRINGKSLGLPAYLSFRSLASGSKILSPPHLATGELDHKGNLLEVCALDQKLKLAQDLKFVSFIYPLDAKTAPLMTSGKPDVVDVKNIEEAEKAWGLGAESIRKRLMPVPFVDDLDRLTQNFTGRQWLVEEIDAWIASPTAEKVYWLTGAPGVGKSSISAWLCKYRKQCIAAKHFCDFSNEDRRDPVKFVRSLAFQLSESCSQYEEQLSEVPVEQLLNDFTDAKTLFDALILRPLSNIQSMPVKPLIIVIDALDEAVDSGRNGIAQIVAKYSAKSPDWLRFLITSRYDDELKANLSPAIPHMLDANAKQNQDDIIACLQERLPESTTEQQLQILSRGEGIFLYVRHCIDEIKSGRLSLEHLDQLPQGLNDIYRRQFDRHFATDLQYYKKEIRPLLRIVCTSFEPLPLGVVRSILGLKNKEALFDLLEMLGSLFPRTGDKDTDCIAPHHRSIKDWISVRELCGHYYVDVESGHSELAEYGWNEYLKTPENLTEYLYAWLPRHLNDCSRQDEAVALLKDFNFMMARTKAGKLERLLTDYKKIKYPSLEIESAFFQKVGHLIQDSSAEWPAYKILFQLAMLQKDKSILVQGAEKYLEEGKCSWPWLKVEYIRDHSSNIFGFMALKDGRMITCTSDGGINLLSKDGGLIKSIDQNTHSIIQPRNPDKPRIIKTSSGIHVRSDNSIASIDYAIKKQILPLNSGEFLASSSDGAYYLCDQSLETRCQVEFTERSDFDTTKIDLNLCGAIVFSDGSFLIWRSDDLSTIISLHNIQGKTCKELPIPRLKPAPFHPSQDEVIKIGENQILFKSHYSAVIVNKELDVVDEFHVAEHIRKSKYEDASDDDFDRGLFSNLNFMDGGIYPLEDGRYISATALSVYLWNKNKDGIFEIETELRPEYFGWPGFFDMTRFDKPRRAVITKYFVYITDGLNEYINHIYGSVDLSTKRVEVDKNGKCTITEHPYNAHDASILADIYGEFLKNRTISGHAKSIIEDMVKNGESIRTFDDIAFTVGYAGGENIIDKLGNIVACYEDQLINITCGYSEKPRKLSLMTLPSGEEVHWFKSGNVVRDISPQGRVVVSIDDGRLFVLHPFVGNQRVIRICNQDNIYYRQDLRVF
jgi:hypothetical protein